MRSLGTPLVLLLAAVGWACTDAPERASDAPPHDLATTAEDQPVRAATAPAPFIITLDLVERFATVHRALRTGGVSTADLDPSLQATELPAEVRQTIEDGGLSPDEFLALNGSLLPAYFVARLREAGLPAGAGLAGVPEAHIAFVLEHRHEIEQLLDLDPER